MSTLSITRRSFTIRKDAATTARLHHMNRTARTYRYWREVFSAPVKLDCSGVLVAVVYRRG